MPAELLRLSGVIVPQYLKEDSTAFEEVKGANGGINVNSLGSATLASGIVNVVTPGTRAQLPNIPCRKVILTAKRANGMFIYVGGTTVSATSYGDDLAAKEKVSVEITNANMVWIDADVAGEGISYFAI